MQNYYQRRTIHFDYFEVGIKNKFFEVRYVFTSLVQFGRNLIKKI